jgi:hypothetical protein
MIEPSIKASEKECDSAHDDAKTTIGHKWFLLPIPGVVIDCVEESAKLENLISSNNLNNELVVVEAGAAKVSLVRSDS